MASGQSTVFSNTIYFRSRMSKLFIPPKVFWIFFAAITVVHVIGMLEIDIMDVDAAQYASMSREMMESGEYLQVKHRHQDYLDKPPLLFWVTSTSFQIFGVSNFTFRLPSFLFMLLGLYSTYKLARLFYDEKTGLLAVLVLYSSQAYFLFSHDVRTDTILANVLVFALWQLALFLKTKNLLPMLLGAFGVGLAMLEKGPIGLMVAAWAIGSQILYKRDWSSIWRWEWLAGLLVLALTLLPMTYGLYEQFGIRGVKFFYWTQSFGRITGESEWQDNSTIFYFVHTFLWAFLPWMLFAYYGIVKKIILLIKERFKNDDRIEVLTLGGFVLAFVALSLSNYKLPHYIFVVFPLAAIITSDAIWGIIQDKKVSRFFVGIQWVIIPLLWVAAGLLCLLAFPLNNVVIGLIGGIFLILAFYALAIRKDLLSKLVYSGLISIIGVNFLLDAHFYPTLLTYQSGSMAGKYVTAQGIDREKLLFFGSTQHAFDFYTGTIVDLVNLEELQGMHDKYVYVSDADYETLIKTPGLKLQELKEFEAYPVTKLRIEFLNPATREEAVSRYYLVYLQ